METAVAARIYQRFFDELAAQGPAERWLAAELRRLQQDGRLGQERLLVELYLSSPQEDS